MGDSSPIEELFKGDRTPENEGEVDQLLKLLTSDGVRIFSVGRFTMAFNKLSTVEAFVFDHKLLVEPQQILTNVALRVIDSRDSILE